MGRADLTTTTRRLASANGRSLQRCSKHPQQQDGDTSVPSALSVKRSAERYGRLGAVWLLLMRMMLESACQHLMLLSPAAVA